MQIRADDVQAPKLRDLGILGRIPAAEHDVDAPAGHVRRDSDRAPGPCPRDQLRLPRVMLRIQHAARHASLLQFARQPVRFRHACRSYQNRPARAVNRSDLGQQRPLLSQQARTDERWLILPPAWPVRRNDGHLQLISILQLVRRGAESARHAADRRIEAQQMLQRNHAENAAARLRAPRPPSPLRPPAPRPAIGACLRSGR